MRFLPVSSKGALVVLLAAAALAAPDQGRAQEVSVEAQWAPQGRFHAYVRDLVGPGALLGTAASATVDQIRTDPDRWGADAGGFARRAASHAGTLVVEQTVRHGLAITLGRSTRYQRCDCSGLGPRIGHAIQETFTDRDRADQRALSLPRFGGVIASAAAQPLWRPDVKASEVALTAGSALAFEAAGNVVKELLGWRR